MIYIGNAYYFLFIFLTFLLCVSLYFLLKNKTQKTQKIVLFLILAVNFVLHFLKLAFRPYLNNFPSALSSITFETICGTSTLLFPIFFLTKRENICHDFMFFIGICSGLGAIIFPAEPVGKSALSFDVLRFYFCHFSLIAVPLVSACLNLHRPKLKNFWAMPLFFFGYEIIIFLNEFILMKTGITGINSSQFLDRNIRNISFVFGPTAKFDKLKIMLDIFVPKIFRINFFGPQTASSEFYFPILWLSFPVLIYFPIIYLIMCSPFQILKKFSKEKKI